MKQNIYSRIRESFALPGRIHSVMSI